MHLEVLASKYSQRKKLQPESFRYTGFLPENASLDETVVTTFRGLVQRGMEIHIGLAWEKYI
jgi:hypothetical protein